MQVCTDIAVDFDTRRVTRNGAAIWDTRLFKPEEDAEARVFLEEKQREVNAALSRRFIVIDGDWFHAAWIAETGRVLVESEGVL